MIERLHFGSDAPYSGLEASIHLARYQLARDYARGRRVLDIACGEGYGSAWLRQWGATEVDGVDVSVDAVELAKANFGIDGVRFHAYDAQRAVELFPDRKFDLIVSLETIEHLPDPKRYLLNLKSLLAEGGILIISCPNDWWYYPSEQESNPYHLRKYHFDEFRAMASEVLGEADRWGIGTALAGFVNFDHQTIPRASGKDDQRLMMASQPCENAYIVPVTAADMTRPENSSYFFGVWGTSDVTASAAVLPVPMDVFRNGLYGSQPDGEQLEQAMRAVNAAALERERGDHDAYEAHLREARLRMAALVAENKVLKANMEKVRFAGREAESAVGYWRSEWDQLLEKHEALRREAESANEYWRSEWNQLLEKYEALRRQQEAATQRSVRVNLGRAATKLRQVLKRVR
ncbi:bifunctional 2-polyprenyl-6-hydroxyphenol methylase/3-demethylubiquinol 3-O-methyltransferase UbiG [Cupriavidus sp. AU9028]|uniref:class I SAM-dependent methyltransferase n=1 Tax=Cupriavidus sp. AU9028 TaxID=2871157 RepID=UPI001C9529DD|nr:class I SAM-dependent methyltransferase [Cupriavidus sp. AU9028]MBY4898116.1 class I SAM-dependent methyltransferase [Cupriavidus sp. AU9028]